MKINFKQISLTKLYLSWVLLLISLMIIYIFSGRYYEMNAQAVLKVSSSIPSNISTKTMVLGFIAISIIVGLMIMGIGYLLVRFAAKGKKWAQWLFLIFCLSKHSLQLLQCQNVL